MSAEADQPSGDKPASIAFTASESRLLLACVRNIADEVNDFVSDTLVFSSLGVARLQGLHHYYPFARL